MKKLADYIKRSGLDQAEFAHKCGVSPATICRILSGKTSDPAVSVTLKIEVATKGAVRPQDWAT